MWIECNKNKAAVEVGRKEYAETLSAGVAEESKREVERLRQFLFVTA